MSNAKDILDRVGPAMSDDPLPPFIGKDLKATIHAEQIPFMIVEVRPRVDGQYGEQCIFTVQLEGEDGEHALALKLNGYRKRVAEALAEGLAENGGKPIGPFFLGKYRSKGGNDVWTIEAERVERPQTRAQAVTGRSLPATGDDGIPY